MRPSASTLTVALLGDLMTTTFSGSPSTSVQDGCTTVSTPTEPVAVKSLQTGGSFTAVTVTATLAPAHSRSVSQTSYSSVVWPLKFGTGRNRTIPAVTSADPFAGWVTIRSDSRSSPWSSESFARTS